tara:strand:- start:309 stop:602 length:294 start_codon:yes stop_codon:yes gene_type:complete
LRKNGHHFESNSINYYSLFFTHIQATNSAIRPAISDSLELYHAQVDPLYNEDLRRHSRTYNRNKIVEIGAELSFNGTVGYLGYFPVKSDLKAPVLQG